jgi:undecaprenyl-diphosphatase
MSIFNGLLVWSEKTFYPLGSFGLFILAFIESSVFPIPPDILLVIFCLAEPSKALWFALITSVGSVLGGMFGYLIGYGGEKIIVDRIISSKKIERVHRLFDKYGAFAVFIAGFTPIPYKIFTIGAGLFYINFKKFVIASFFGRGMRFFAEAILIMLYGRMIVNFMDKYFGWVTIIVVILIVIGYIFYRKYKK